MNERIEKSKQLWNKITKSNLMGTEIGGKVASFIIPIIFGEVDYYKNLYEHISLANNIAQLDRDIDNTEIETEFQQFEKIINTTFN